GKILADAASKKPCTVESQQSEITHTDRVNGKQKKRFATILSTPNSIKQNLPQKAKSPSIKQQSTVENQASPVPGKEQAAQNQQINSDNQTKTADKDAIGQILATVQQLINVSLYASINNSVSDTVEPEAKVTNPRETSSKENLDNSSNATNQKVASNTNVNTVKILAVVQELITTSISASLNNTVNNSIQADIQKPGEIALTNLVEDKKKNNLNQLRNTLRNNRNKIAANNSKNNSLRNSLINKLRGKNELRLAQVPGEPFLVGIMINGREVGTLDIIEENNTLLIPLETLGEVSGFTIKNKTSGIEVKTPLGTVQLPPEELKQINGLTYVSKE
ncbi:MAG: Cna B-type, partial [Cyanobacteria bacterium J06649_11]